MTDNTVVIDETMRIAKGTALLTAVSLVICLMIGQLDFPMVLGFILGSIYAVYNFYRMGINIERSFALPPHKAQTYMTSRYFLRMLTTGIVIFIGFYSDYINNFGIIIPLIFPKLTLFISEIFRKEEKP